MPVTVEDVSGHIVAVGPGKVQIEVGRCFAEEVDEAFEVEVQVYGIYIGDAQAVGDETVGTTATADGEITLPTGILHDVPVDEKVRHEPFFDDDVELLVGCARGWSCSHFRTDGAPSKVCWSRMSASSVSDPEKNRLLRFCPNT